MQKRKNYLPYGLHWINQDDIEAVKKVLEGNWITQGPKIEEFEKKLASYIGTKYSVAVNSGTAALELAARCTGLGKKTRAITTPLSFVASANAILFNNAEVDFVDIDKETFNILPEAIEKAVKPETKTVIPVHFAGQCCEMDKILKIAKKKELEIVEDCAHALGAEFNGKKAGSFGKTGCFSFHPVKHLTMGEGGAITTDNKEVFERLLRLRNHGIDKNARQRHGANVGYEYDVVELSRNFRVNDIACALGLSEFKRLESFLKRREEIAKRYSKAFEGLKGIEIQKIAKGAKHAWHLYCVLVENRDRMFKFLRGQNIGVNVHYLPIYKHSFYRKKYCIKPEQFPNTEFVSKRILSLPMFPRMKDEDIEYVIAKVKEGLKEVNGK